MTKSSGPGEPRFCRWLVAARYPLLLVAAILAALAWIPAGQLEFDRSIENMFSPDDPLLVPYGRLKRTFGGDETVLATYTDPQLMTDAGMQRLEEIHGQIRKTAGVAAVLSLLSPLDGDRFIEPDDAMPDRPMDDYHIIAPDNPMADRLRALFEGYTHGADGQTSSLVVIFKRLADAAVTRQETIARLREIIRRMPDGSLCGEPVMVADGFRYLEEDGRRLATMSTVLLTLTIAVCFRSLRWVLIPVAVVQFTLLLTRAVLVVLGFHLSMVSSMLSAIVT
ncbi:MAG: MMPL family transporter, partial [Pirellulales bacterium]